MTGRQRNGTARIVSRAQQGIRLRVLNLTGVTAIARLNLGESLLDDGRLDAAEASQRKAAALLTAALVHDNAVANWRGYNEQSTLLAAQIASRQGSIAEAQRGSLCATEQDGARSGWAYASVSRAARW
jgi:hypothetical protein